LLNGNRVFGCILRELAFIRHLQIQLVKHSVCRNGQMQMTFTDMLSVDCTNEGRMAKDGNTQVSKAQCDGMRRRGTQ
jgi:hypothetical protein